MSLGLGTWVKDVHSEFEGLVVGRSEYLHRSAQIQVDPCILKDGVPLEAIWVDESRLVESTRKDKKITLRQEVSNGEDHQA